jgi:hypothetical protein
MDPRNVTLEPEYYEELDLERYAPRKPLIWLWEMFDRSPLGENVALGIRFRRILAKHVFGAAGRTSRRSRSCAYPSATTCTSATTW